MNPLLPALRPDLQLAESAAGINGAPQWVLADPLTGRYFTLTPTAIRLLRHWSLRLPQQVLAAANQEPGLPLQVKELEQLLQFLRQHDLVTSGDAEQRQRYLSKARAMRTSLWKKVLHQYLFSVSRSGGPIRCSTVAGPGLSATEQQYCWEYSR